MIHYLMSSSNEFSILVFDHCGVGMSEAPKKLRYTTKSMAKDALGLLEYVGWTKSVHLLGCSLGGMVCQFMAAYRPSNFLSLTIVSAAGKTRLPLSVVIRGSLVATCNRSELRASRVVRLLFPKRDLRRPSRHSQYATKVGRKFCWWIQMPSTHPLFIYCPYPSQREEYQNLFQDVYELSGPHSLRGHITHLAAILLHRFPHKYAKRIRRSRIPVMVMTGTRDSVVSVKRVDMLSRRLRARLEVFEGGGHSLHLQFTSLYASLLKQNIARGEERLPARSEEESDLMLPKGSREKAEPLQSVSTILPPSGSSETAIELGKSESDILIVSDEESEKEKEEEWEEEKEEEWEEEKEVEEEGTGLGRDPVYSIHGEEHLLSGHIGDTESTGRDSALDLNEEIDEMDSKFFGMLNVPPATAVQARRGTYAFESYDEVLANFTLMNMIKNEANVKRRTRYI
ncbi:uncharacterized protein VTP21DRAFT_4649 [Calcarisporiella thermophila]|uniref:uncharacterized protein n=1 Tax=Calcarisporiella thermophila TaxID=911321 RepID=UPI0037425706